MKNKKSYEVIVIGGGVCGCAIAYHLAKEGVRVALVEKGDICSAASGANLGFSVLSYRQNPITLKMAQDQLLVQGKIILSNFDITNVCPREIIKHGVGYIPGDRHTSGLIFDMDLKENIILKDYNIPPPF